MLQTLISDLPGGCGTCWNRLSRTGPIRRAAWFHRHPARPSLFGLAPCGVYPASGFTVGAVRSYRTVSPLPRGRYCSRRVAARPKGRIRFPGRFVFCGTCRLHAFQRASRTLSGTLSCGVRTFLSRLRSLPHIRQRPHSPPAAYQCNPPPRTTPSDPQSRHSIPCLSFPQRICCWLLLLLLLLLLPFWLSFPQGICCWLFAFAFARALLVVIPAGNLLLATHHPTRDPRERHRANAHLLHAMPTNGSAVTL